jgi:hypothetical protein
MADEKPKRRNRERPSCENKIRGLDKLIKLLEEERKNED